jgi:hypothetical protein
MTLALAGAGLMEGATIDSMMTVTVILITAHVATITEIVARRVARIADGVHTLTVSYANGERVVHDARYDVMKRRHVTLACH